MGFDISRGVFNIFNVNIKNATLIKYAGNIINIILILVIIKIIIKVSYIIIEKFFRRQKKSRFGMNEKKADTLSELLKSILRYVLYFIAIVSIFETLWPNIKTTIALTSVVGVAVGFGGQSLVKDVISGFFILFEDQFAVGDYVVIEGMSGTVEALGLRVTKIRDFSGDLHVIPNGSIVKVTNKSRGNMRAMVEIDICYDEDIDRAIEKIKKICEQMKNEFDYIVEGPEVIGITNFGDSGITIRIVAKTLPMQQWSVEVELRHRIKHALDDENIKLAYPRRVIVDNRGKDESGN